MRSIRLCFTLLFVLSIALMLAAPSVAPAFAQSSTPTFTKNKCPFPITADSGQVEGQTLTCGTVTVPEDHSKPNGKTIQLAVAVFKSVAAKPQSDPVIYLDGGPGGFSLVQALDLLGLFKPILDTRDLIFFDQRGVGYSTPSLYCPETTKLDHDLISVEISPTEGAKRFAAAMLACQNRLVSAGVNLQVYNTDQNAADVDLIRQALGYKTINLYGISYGTRLALTTMRDFPSNIRSSVIDSVVPIEQQMLVGQTPGMERVFKQLWDGCAADAACNAAYPNLEKVFYETVDKLNKTPVTVKTTDPNNVAYNEVIDGNGLINFLFQTFYVTSFIPSVPAVIYAAYHGNLKDIARISLIFLDEDKTSSNGMYFTVNCQEDLAYETIAQVQAAAKGLPQELLDNQIPSIQGEFDVCKNLGVAKAPAIDKPPVKSSIPTLVLAGSYDPVTPPSYSKQVADELGNAYYFEIPNSGHGASIAGDCPFSLVTDFLNTPTQKPNGSCVASIGPPQFQ